MTLTTPPRHELPHIADTPAHTRAVFVLPVEEPTNRRSRSRIGRHRDIRSSTSPWWRRAAALFVVAALCAVGVGAWRAVDVVRGSSVPIEQDAAASVSIPPLVAHVAGDPAAFRSVVRPPGMPAAAPGREWHPRPLPDVPVMQTNVPPSPVPPPTVAAEHALVMDARTGAVLFAKDEHQKVAVASTTKILTALTVLRLAGLQEPAVVSRNAEQTGERSINIRAGEQLSVERLLAAMLVGSANDAAMALGEHVGGSQRAYGILATWLAHELGANDTNVVNPHGLDAPGHESSAYDLALLSRVGLADPEFAKWVATKEHAFDAPGPEQRIAENKNRLLSEYPGAIGVKTGSTADAGNCLVAAASREGQTFIAVALDSTDPTADDKAMLDWAFANYRTVELGAAGETVDVDGQNPVLATPLVVTVPAGDVEDLTIRLDADGTKVEAVLDGTVLAEAETA